MKIVTHKDCCINGFRSNSTLKTKTSRREEKKNTKFFTRPDQTRTFSLPSFSLHLVNGLCEDFSFIELIFIISWRGNLKSLRRRLSFFFGEVWKGKKNCFLPKLFSSQSKIMRKVFLLEKLAKILQCVDLRC